MIANWFNQKLNIQFPERKTIFGRKYKQLRYGENPHQKGSIYINSYDDKKLGLQQLAGKDLSYNNYNDIFSSLEILSSMKINPTTVIIKHANPCGVSANKIPIISFKNAYACDPVSAFGGVVACNFRINKAIALEINKKFLEVILATGFEKDAFSILSKKKNLRIIDTSKYKQKNQTATKTFDGSFLLQQRDKLVFRKKDLKFVTKNKPTVQELKEIDFAFNISKYVKSNAIVLTNNFSTIGIGAGQPSRLDSCKIAVQKARQFQSNKIRNSIAASDAFFPFADGIKSLITAGVKIIIHPGGSIRDQEIIDAANKANIKMIFTGIRHFNH
jgi:phosphoribosylaminoimidazolecarboxamide formyltransferase/IMP cyclohydrolase